jgi:hypothetical protein
MSDFGVARLGSRRRRGASAGADLGDRGDIVVGWLTKIVVLSALVGLVGFDAVSVAVSRVSVVDDANSAVQAASLMWQSSHHNIVESYQAAQGALPDGVDEEVDVKGFSIQPDGTVQLTVHKTSKTLLLHHIHRFAHLAVVQATESGKSIGS